MGNRYFFRKVPERAWVTPSPQLTSGRLQGLNVAVLQLSPSSLVSCTAFSATVCMSKTVHMAQLPAQLKHLQHLLPIFVLCSLLLLVLLVCKSLAAQRAQKAAKATACDDV